MPAPARLAATVALLGAGWAGWQALPVLVDWLGLGRVALPARLLLAILALSLADHLAGALRARLFPPAKDP